MNVCLYLRWIIKSQIFAVSLLKHWSCSSNVFSISIQPQSLQGPFYLFTTFIYFIELHPKQMMNRRRLRVHKRDVCIQWRGIWALSAGPFIISGQSLQKHSCTNMQPLSISCSTSASLCGLLTQSLVHTFSSFPPSKISLFYFTFSPTSVNQMSSTQKLQFF